MSVFFYTRRSSHCSSLKSTQRFELRLRLNPDWSLFGYLSDQRVFACSYVPIARISFRPPISRYLRLSRVDTNVPLKGNNGVYARSASSYDRCRGDRTLKSNVDVAGNSAGGKELKRKMCKGTVSGLTENGRNGNSEMSGDLRCSSGACEFHSERAIEKRKQPTR